jgi:YfiH family protein
MKLIRQVHGNTVITIHNKQEYEALIQNRPEADGIITFDVSLPLYLYTADCLPIYLSGKSNNKPFKGLLHCGWRGAKNRILKQALEKLKNISDLKIQFGPCILPCCFEVKEDLIKAFEAENISVQKFIEEKNDKMFLNLPLLVETLEGVKADKELMRCTFCSEPRLPSYRRDKSIERICTVF